MHKQLNQLVLRKLLKLEKEMLKCNNDFLNDATYDIYYQKPIRKDTENLLKFSRWLDTLSSYLIHYKLNKTEKSLKAFKMEIENLRKL